MLEMLNSLVLVPSFGIQLEPKTAYLAFHIVCFALGIGAATLLDILVARMFIFNRVIEDSDFAIVSYASKVVALGLLLAWISGVLYVGHIYAANPLILENPKFLVKVCIICILTLNGGFIHAVVIPHLKRQVESTLFEGTSMGKRALFLASGSISVVSWYFPVLLGTAKELSFTVPFDQIVMFYLSLALLAFLLISSAKLAAMLWVDRAGTLERLAASCAPLATMCHGKPEPRLVVVRSEPYLRMPGHRGGELPKPVPAPAKRSA